MSKNKKDYLISTIVCQLVFCLIILAVCFILAKRGSPLIDELRVTFSEKLENNEMFEQAADVFKSSVEAQNETTITERTTENKENKVTKPDTESSTAAATMVAEREIKETPSKVSQELPANASMSVYSFNKSMQKPVDGEITSSFGMRTHPVYNEDRFHTGLDIAAEEGTPVKACFDGIVTFAGDDDSFGNYVKISHGNGIETLYCHLQSLYAKKGDRIEAGQVIGFVGQTGIATGPHLHLEIRINGVSYDPYIAYQNAVDEI